MENRESFFKRLEPFLAPSVMLDVQLAYTLAKFGHRAQVRKELDGEGNPVRYFEHVRRVAINLVDVVQIIRPEMICSALLHDVIEDAPNVPAPMIEKFFGVDVVSIVKVLSKDPPEGYLDRFNLCSDWRPYVIKGCDRLDNLRSMSDPTVTLKFRQKQVKETQEKYLPLFDRMVTLTPPEYVGRVQILRDLILRETVRQTVLLEMSEKQL